jgi:hypothetical protein
MENQVHLASSFLLREVARVAYLHQTNNDNSKSHQSQRQTNQRKQYQHQNDFTNLINSGLQVIDNGDVLIVSGDGIFEKKSIIKNAGFRWDGQNRIWYMQKREAA